MALQLKLFSPYTSYIVNQGKVYMLKIIISKRKLILDQDFKADSQLSHLEEFITVSNKLFASSIWH